VACQENLVRSEKEKKEGLVCIDKSLFIALIHRTQPSQNFDSLRNGHIQCQQYSRRSGRRSLWLGEHLHHRRREHPSEAMLVDFRPQGNQSRGDGPGMVSGRLKIYEVGERVGSTNP
jgi:hypothetical protein